MIVFLSTRYSVGGAQMNAVMLAEQAQARGEPVELWFLTRTGEMAPTAVPVRILADAPPKGGLGWLGLAARFFGQVRKARPAAMFAFHPLSCVLGALGVLVHRYVFVASQNNPPESYTPAVRVVEKAVGSTPLYRSNIAVSHAVKDAFAGYPAAYRDRLVVVHNATPPLPHSDDDKTASRIALGLPVDAPLVGNVGRLADQKYPEFLVEVVSRMETAHLVLAGEGPNQQAVVDLAARLGVSDRVHLLGRVGGAALTRAYRSLDVFLMPSRFEGFGRTLVEAFACDVPAVAHDLPVLREVAEGGALLLPLNAELWADQVEGLLLDPPRRDAMIEAGQRRERHFSIEAMTNGYLAAIGR